MAALIDITYFESGLRLIPNLDKVIVSEALETAIDTYQDKFMKEQFGYEFQKLMLANQNVEMYKNILDGVEWTDDNNDLQKWEGIKEPLADYVYFYYIKEQSIKLQGVGYTVGTIENGTIVAPQTIPIAVYNRFVGKMDELYDYLDQSSIDYTKVIWKHRWYLNEFGF